MSIKLLLMASLLFPLAVGTCSRSNSSKKENAESPQVAQGVKTGEFKVFALGAEPDAISLGRRLPITFTVLVTGGEEGPKNLELLEIVDKPMLVGMSRKSMIYKTLQTSPEHALNGTTALNMIALEKGANILRVHDVKEAMECVTLFNQLQK